MQPSDAFVFIAHILYHDIEDLKESVCCLKDSIDLFESQARSQRGALECQSSTWAHTVPALGVCEACGRIEPATWGAQKSSLLSAN